MAVSSLNRIIHLRKSALHCRELSLGAIPVGVVKELEDFAADLDAEANRMEQRDSTQGHVVSIKTDGASSSRVRTTPHAPQRRVVEPSR